MWAGQEETDREVYADGISCGVLSHAARAAHATAARPRKGNTKRRSWHWDGRHPLLLLCDKYCQSWRYGREGYRQGGINVVKAKIQRSPAVIFSPSAWPQSAGANFAFCVINVAARARAVWGRLVRRRTGVTSFSKSPRTTPVQATASRRRISTLAATRRFMRPAGALRLGSARLPIYCW